MTEPNYKRKATGAAAITFGAFLLFGMSAKAQSSFSPPDLTQDGVVINKVPPPLHTAAPGGMSSGPPRGAPSHQVSLIPGSSLDMTTPPPLTTPNLEIMSVPTPKLSTGEDIKQAVANINKIKHEENMRRAAAEEALKESFGFQPGMAGATPSKLPAKQPETKIGGDNHVASGPSGPPPLPCQDDNGDMRATLAQCSKEMRVINSANLMLQSAPKGYVSAENLQEMTPIATSPNGKDSDGVECVVSSLTSAGTSMTHFKAEDIRECISASTHMTYQMPGVSNIVILGSNIGEIKISCRRPPPDGIQIECAKE